jgi:2-polyprenyl-3-methyl-5-hydroxy-6-metoxy-1,4-benzoquinol methylase
MIINQNESRLSQLLTINQELIRSDSPSIKKLLYNESDEFWFWLLTDGYSADSRIIKSLPTMPEERIQLNFTGRCGKDALLDAFSAYQFFKNIAKKHLKKVSDQDAILDFGCGWGRIIRFFLKDLESSQIYGADCYKEMIDLCKQQNLNCNFDFIEPMPPIKYQDNMFDVIYLFSVFSHLSEEAHLAWLGEFQRILKPGGIFIATTRPAEFIEYCQMLAKKKDVVEWALGSAIAFSDPAMSLRDYQDGKFVHAPTGGGGVLDKSFFGESCIPEQYVKTKWNKFFNEIEYIPASSHKQFDQTVIVGIK